MDRVEAVVIGAGVVGLAVAREIARRGREVLVLEAAPLIGSGTSARNSEVIHAGIYYRQRSLKATLCVRGRELLYRYAAERGIPHARCGKLIVAATEAQRAELALIEAAAASNGVNDLERVSAEAVAEMEPELRCTEALHSPSTGIIDSHSLMLGFQGDIEDHGGVVVVDTPVLSACLSDSDGGVTVTTGGSTPMVLHCDAVVNAAGLTACHLGQDLQIGLPPPPIPHFAKGNYYTLCGRSPFSRLVYPVPEPCTAGLGVHATIDLAGRTRFGPDVEWLTPGQLTKVRSEEFPEHLYPVDPDRAAGFYAAIREYWPGLQDGQLQADYSGVRPKLTGPDDAQAADFLFQYTHESRRAGLGWGGSVALYGIESPGLTASMGLAELVCAEGLGLLPA